MPASYAHRRFGRDVAAMLPEELLNVIQAHRSLFDIGLHGPDIFFYYQPFYSNAVGRIGYGMHDMSGGQVFRMFVNLWNRSGEDDAARAYLYGFLCHFALDSMCHGYVDQMDAMGVASHSKLEMELDRSFLELDGLDPEKTDLVSHIQPTEENARVIGGFFPQATRNQVKKSLEGMVRCHHLLMVPNRAKRFVLEGAIGLIGKRDSFGGMVMSREPDPACVPLTLRLRDMYRAALPMAVELITEFPQFTHPQYRLDFEGRPVKSTEVL